MSDATKPNGGDQAGAPEPRPGFDRLPIVLSARLARGAATVRHLRALGTGDLVPLKTAVGEPAHLVAEGAAIGDGEIVEIGGQLNLRITRIGVERG